MFPERQIGPHKNWDDEVHFLDNVFGTDSLRPIQSLHALIEVFLSR